MNPITDALFTVTWFLLLIWAGRSILRGWSKPVRNFNAGTWTTQVTKRVHPEMEGVKTGEELLVYTPEEDEEDDDDGDIPTYR